MNLLQAAKGEYFGRSNSPGKRTSETSTTFLLTPVNRSRKGKKLKKKCQKNHFYDYYTISIFCGKNEYYIII